MGCARLDIVVAWARGCPRTGRPDPGTHTGRVSHAPRPAHAASAIGTLVASLGTDSIFERLF